MMPGINQKQLANAKIDEKQLSRTEAIILSMTKKERDDPDILNFSRKKRIAAGSGTKIEDINRLLKQFEMTRQLAKKMSGGKMPKDFGGPGAKNSKGFRYPFR
jgi:signal recognition particle subunit SRP54